MIQVEEKYPIRKANIQSSLNNTRLIGRSSDQNLLFFVYTGTVTLIESVSLNGDLTTVTQFQGYRDIIQADFCFDPPFLHLIERSNTETSIRFQSRVIAFHSFSETIVRESADPMFAVMIPPKDTDKNQVNMLHSKQTSLTHFKVYLEKQKIQVKKVSGGLHFENIVQWEFNKQNHMFIALAYSDNQFRFVQFVFEEPTFRKLFDLPIKNFVPCNLPDFLSLSPLRSQHQYFCSPFKTRIALITYHQSVILVQHIFNPNSEELSFEIQRTDPYFNSTIQIPNVKNEYPICFMKKLPFCFVFVPNHFIFCFIADSDPFFLATLRQPFCICPTGIFCVTLNPEKLIVDLDFGSLFYFDITFASPNMFVQSLNLETISCLAKLSAECFQDESICALFDLLWLRGEISFLVSFVHTMIFHKCPTYTSHSLRRSESFRDSYIDKTPPSEIVKMAVEFPSAGFKRRKDIFIHFLSNISQKRPALARRLVHKHAIQYMEDQNKLSQSLQRGIDLWIQKSKSDNFFKFFTSLAISLEIHFASFPIIPRLRENVTRKLMHNAHPIVSHLLAHNHVINLFNTDQTELTFWLIRHPTLFNKTSMSSSTISSTSSCTSIPSMQIVRNESFSTQTNSENFSFGF